MKADGGFAATGMRAAGWQSFGLLEGFEPESPPQLMRNVRRRCHSRSTWSREIGCHDCQNVEQRQRKLWRQNHHARPQAVFQEGLENSGLGI